MLRWRLLFGAFFIAALAAIMWMDAKWSPPGVWLFALTVVTGMAAAQEIVSLLRRGSLQPSAGLIYGGTLLVLASNAVPIFLADSVDEGPLARLAWPLLAFTLVLLATLVFETYRYRQPGSSMVLAGLTLLSVAYVGLLLSFAIQLRLLGGSGEGLVGLAALVIVVKTGDTAAYTIGRLLGRHKLSPLVSPGKTIEGAIGAIVFATLGAWLSLNLLPGWMNIPISQPNWAWVAFGPLVGLAGLLGDLAESLMKRDMQQKDSSSWLPGFGGVLDLVDAILLAAPVAYGCWLAGLTLGQ